MQTENESGFWALDCVFETNKQAWRGQSPPKIIFDCSDQAFWVSFSGKFERIGGVRLMTNVEYAFYP